MATVLELVADPPAGPLSDSEAACELLSTSERLIARLPDSSHLRWALVASLGELERLAERPTRTPRAAPAPRNRIRELRGVQGLTLSDVADRLGVTAADIAAYENGGPIPDEHAVALGDLFRVRERWLLGVENETRPREA